MDVPVTIGPVDAPPRYATRWARAGKVSAIRTLGGHRRFRKSEILEQLADLVEQ